MRQNFSTNQWLSFCQLQRGTHLFINTRGEKTTDHFKMAAISTVQDEKVCGHTGLIYSVATLISRLISGNWTSHGAIYFLAPYVFFSRLLFISSFIGWWAESIKSPSLIIVSSNIGDFNLAAPLISNLLRVPLADGCLLSDLTESS